MTVSVDKPLLFVLGMHRSGTSALCAALRSSGAGFGDQLLQPMAGVNDEGFWEDSDVVAINESLIQQVGTDWYSLRTDLLDQEWCSDHQFSAQRESARTVLTRRIGSERVEVLKDPRLCLTLPLWQSLCDELGITHSACVINRAPIEVARSLQKRDGFPLGYGLRLYLLYRESIARHAPPETIYLRYDQLLTDPAGCMGRLAGILPLEISQQELSTAVRADLRHHAGETAGGPLFSADDGDFDARALSTAIEQYSPPDRVLTDMAEILVERGVELSSIGASHSEALATLDQRDADLRQLTEEYEYATGVIEKRDQELDGIGQHLEQALETIKERDEQIAEFDRRLSKLGEEHSYALNLIQARDQQLQRCFDKPGIGLLFKTMWKHEQR